MRTEPTMLGCLTERLYATALCSWGLLGEMKKPHSFVNCAAFNLVPEAGLEPARLAAGDFESPASTNFTTPAGFVKS